jgi:phosphate transport system protein
VGGDRRGTFHAELTRRGDLAATLFRMGMDAYAEDDAAPAASLDQLDDGPDALHAGSREAVLRWGEDGHVREAVQLALVGRFHERIGDHAVNIEQRVRYRIDGTLRVEGAST